MTDEISFEPSASHSSTRRRVTIWATAGVLGAGAIAAGGLLTDVNAHAASGSSTTARAALVVDSSSSPAPSGTTPKPGPKSGGRGGGPGGFGGRFGGPGSFGGGGFGGAGGLGRTLHSEATVSLPKGGTEIVDTQAGTITAIDTASSTVTVTSSDKVAFSYVLSSTTRLLVFSGSVPPKGTPPATATPPAKPTPPAKATISSLKVGDTVNVTAIRSGDTRTASSLIDGVPTRPAGGAHFGGKGGFGGRGGQGGQGGPRGSASASASPQTQDGAATT